MSHKIVTLVGASLIAVALFGFYSPGSIAQVSAPQSATKWEYLVDVAGASHEQRVLNDRGQQGWELVTLLDRDDQSNSYFIFKRIALPHE